jgi:hypothetical protein
MVSAKQLFMKGPIQITSDIFPASMILMHARNIFGRREYRNVSRIYSVYSIPDIKENMKLI